MSKNKGFSETSAGRYSLALYELAIEADMLSEIEVHSGSIINLIDSVCTSISLSILASVANSYSASEYLSADVSEKPLFLLNLLFLINIWRFIKFLF